jgi:hypothetical protein
LEVRLVELRAAEVRLGEVHLGEVRLVELRVGAKLYEVFAPGAILSDAKLNKACLVGMYLAKAILSR